MARYTMVVGLVLFAVPLQSVQAEGWFFWGEGPHWGTKEYYELHANSPPGARQIYKDGKLWPPFPRPVGPHQPFVHKFHHTHYWPYPYSCEDRASVATFVNVQVANGWAAQTTLYDYHFDPRTNELNSSGKAHLRWIMVNVPENHRQVHVATWDDPGRTAARTSNVERELAHMTGTNSGMQVLPRMGDPSGRPAAEVQSIFKSAQENMPPPILSTTAGEQGKN